MSSEKYKDFVFFYKNGRLCAYKRNNSTSKQNKVGNKPKKIYPGEITDETSRYRKMNPKKNKALRGKVTKDNGINWKNSKNEIYSAEWFARKTGENIHVVKPPKQTALNEGEKSPDYINTSKNTSWEEKGIKKHEFNAIKRAVKKASKQIAKNPGGVIINVPKNKTSVKMIRNAVKDGMRDNKEQGYDVVVRKKNKLLVAYRKK